jgi:hypothetical protein
MVSTRRKKIQKTERKPKDFNFHFDIEHSNLIVKIVLLFVIFFEPT